MKKRIFMLFVFILIFLFLKKSVLASSLTKAHLIFDKKSYEAGEKIKLVINLENFTDLNETKVIIKIDEKYLVPVKTNNEYGLLRNDSIYDDVLFNDYNNNYLRFHLIKKNTQAGYFSGQKNNVGEFNFEARTSVPNIYDLFQTGDFTQINCGINISLFDLYNREIDVKICYSEKIKVRFTKEKYEIEVFDEIPSYLDDLEILNRTKAEYEIIDKSVINNKVLGPKIISLIIYDKTNGDEVLLSKVIDIKDSTPPLIKTTEEIEILSSATDQFKIENEVLVSDNYDPSPILNIIYYNMKKEQISYEEFRKNLKRSLFSSVLVQAVDSSSNKSKEIEIKIKIKDVTPPIITNISHLEIDDDAFLKFAFSKEIKITDDYDLSPKLILNYTSDEINEKLRKDYEVNVIYYAKDNSNNESQKYSCLIKLKDKTPPEITKLNDLTIIDKEISKFDFDALINISDNLDLSAQIVKAFYIEKIQVTEEKFKEGLLKGKKGSFSYYGIDHFQNKTEVINVNFNIKDTSAPVIDVSLKDGGIYKKISKIDYRVFDLNEVVVTSYLNDEIYDGKEIKSPGNYTFKIKATDKYLNETEKTIKFKISENSVTGFMNNVESYFNNYLVETILVLLLFVLILTIIIIKVFIHKKKKKLF